MKKGQEAPENKEMSKQDAINFNLMYQEIYYDEPLATGNETYPLIP
jgi:hypothetical protein